MDVDESRGHNNEIRWPMTSLEVERAINGSLDYDNLFKCLEAERPHYGNAPPCIRGKVKAPI